MTKKKMNLLNVKLYLEYYKKDITDKYNIFISNIVLDNDVLNVLNDKLYITTFDKYNKLQQENKQLKELLDTILTFDFFEYECPLNLGFEENTKETGAQNLFYEDEYCENNCNDCYKKCWLKYFERLKELERGVNYAKYSN